MTVPTKLPDFPGHQRGDRGSAHTLSGWTVGAAGVAIPGRSTVLAVLLAVELAYPCDGVTGDNFRRSLSLPLREGVDS